MELGEKLDVRSFTTALARSRILEERLEELRALDVDFDLGTVDLGKVEEELIVFPLALAQRWLVGHVDGLALGL